MSADQSLVSGSDINNMKYNKYHNLKGCIRSAQTRWPWNNILQIEMASSVPRSQAGPLETPHAGTVWIYDSRRY